MVNSVFFPKELLIQRTSQLSWLLCCTLVLCSLASCQTKTFDTEEELWAYIKNPENGYHYQKQVGDVYYSLTYRPTDVLVKQFMVTDFQANKLDSLREIYSNYLYFNLSLSSNGQELLSGQAGDRNAFGTMVNQLAFDMDNKVHLISKKRDTIPMADYVYPRMYGMTNSTNLLLVYPKDKRLFAEDFFHFTIEDLGLATGEVGFKIPVENLKKEPKLNFEL